MTAGEDVSHLISRIEENLDHIGGLLSPPQRALARDRASRLTRLSSTVPALASHGDFHHQNWLWDTASAGLGIIDQQRAEPVAAIRDLARLEDGPRHGKPGLREHSSPVKDAPSPRRKTRRSSASPSSTPSAACGGAWPRPSHG
ncbi:MAG: phosphotransferase [Mycobacterium sp.]